MIGTVDQVARKLEQFCQDIHFSARILFWVPSCQDLLRKKPIAHLEIFVKEVMPHFREA